MINKNQITLINTKTPYMSYRPPTYNSLPPVVKNLLILNVLCFVVVHLLQPQLLHYLALHLWGARDFAPHQLITHIFMHGSIGHIFFNMFALWTFGSVLEQIWGSKRFLIYYCFTGIGAALLYLVTAHWEMQSTAQLFDAFLTQPTPANLSTILQKDVLNAIAYCGILPDANICDTYEKFISNATLFIKNDDKSLLNSLMTYVSDYKAYWLNLRTAVGASGAIYGLIMAYAVIAPNQTLYFYGILPIKARYFAILLGIVALVMGLQNNAGDNIAHFAHLGGMVFGCFLLYYWRNKGHLYR